MSDNIPVNQHYVPQFLLRNFAANKKEQVHVFDKLKENKFLTSVRNIAAENSFYNFDIDGNTESIEEILSQIEADSTQVIEKIKKNKSLANISREEKVTLANFIHVQKMRVKNFKEELFHMGERFSQELQKRGIDPDNVQNFHPMDENEVTKMMNRVILSGADFLHNYLNKAWLLLEAPAKNPFYISDNPISMQNHRYMGLKGNIGLAVPGIEIYFPISNELTLALLCKSHEKNFREAKRMNEQLEKSHPELLESIDEEFVKDEYVESIDKGTPFECRPLIIKNLNSLQVIYAERFIFSSKRNFSLAEEMIEETDDLRQGPRSQMG